jgi:signal transduction histidine kinase
MTDRRRILVVDDSASTRLVICAHLDKRGHHTEQAESAFQALTKLETLPPFDVILLDNMMEGLDGLEFFKRLKFDMRLAIPVVMMTTMSSIHLVVEFMKMGGADFIPKPLTNFDIVEIIIEEAIRNAALRMRTLDAESKSRAAEAAAELIQLFISKMGHELVTPCHQIRAALTFIEEDQSCQGAEEWLSIIRDSTDRFMRLVVDVLDLSRLQHRTLRLDRRDLDFGELLSSVVAACNAAEEKHLTVRLACQAIRASVDTVRMKQVLENLLNNACRYAPPGSEILIAAQDDGEFLTCSVSDLGTGVPEELRQSIFDAFSQGGESHQASGTLGLGLAICREIVRLHGGTIRVEPVEPTGASFVFTLPLRSSSVGLPP